MALQRAPQAQQTDHEPTTRPNFWSMVAPIAANGISAYLSGHPGAVRSMQGWGAKVDGWLHHASDFLSGFGGNPHRESPVAPACALVRWGVGWFTGSCASVFAPTRLQTLRLEAPSTLYLPPPQHPFSKPRTAGALGVHQCTWRVCTCARACSCERACVFVRGGAVLFAWSCLGPVCACARVPRRAQFRLREYGVLRLGCATLPAP